VRGLYNTCSAGGQNLVAIVGDFNDTPDRDPLSPLIKNTDLKDICVHPQFSNDGRIGTYANGSPSQKIDYILLSPQLFDKVTSGSIFRKGVWGGTNGTLFDHYPEMGYEYN
jgi:endonuclease/exonuclease/phosphatase family metal-dependent hydrolase